MPVSMWPRKLGASRELWIQGKRRGRRTTTKKKRKKKKGDDENGNACGRGGAFQGEAFKRWKLPPRIKHSCVLCASHKDNNSRLFFEELAIKLPISYLINT